MWQLTPDVASGDLTLNVASGDLTPDFRTSASESWRNGAGSIASVSKGPESHENPPLLHRGRRAGGGIVARSHRPRADSDTAARQRHSAVRSASADPLRRRRLACAR